MVIRTKGGGADNRPNKRNAFLPSEPSELSEVGQRTPTRTRETVPRPSRNTHTHSVALPEKCAISSGETCGAGPIPKGGRAQRKDLHQPFCAYLFSAATPPSELLMMPV